MFFCSTSNTSAASFVTSVLPNANPSGAACMGWMLRCEVVRKLLFLLLVACNTATLKYPPEAGQDSGDDAGDFSVHVIVEPSDSGSSVVAAINGAQTSVHM